MTQISLRIYCWIDSHQFSRLKGRSALLRLSTKALADLSAAPSPTGPDKVAETPFLHGENGRQSSKRNGTVETHSHRGEGGLHNEQQDIQKQARANALPSEGVNLLTANPAPFDHKNN